MAQKRTHFVYNMGHDAVIDNNKLRQKKLQKLFNSLGLRIFFFVQVRRQLSTNDQRKLRSIDANYTDEYNLDWKLSFSVHSGAAERMIESYTKSVPKLIQRFETQTETRIWQISLLCLLYLLPLVNNLSHVARTQTHAHIDAFRLRRFGSKHMAIEWHHRENKNGCWFYHYTSAGADDGSTHELNRIVDSVEWIATEATYFIRLRSALSFRVLFCVSFNWFVFILCIFLCLPNKSVVFIVEYLKKKT